MAALGFPPPATKAALGLGGEKHDRAARASSKHGMQRCPRTRAPCDREPEAERAKHQKNSCPDPYEHPVPPSIPGTVPGSYKQLFSLTRHNKRDALRLQKRLEDGQTATRQEETEVWCLRVITRINDAPVSGVRPGSQLSAAADLW